MPPPMIGCGPAGAAEAVAGAASTPARAVANTAVTKRKRMDGLLPRGGTRGLRVGEPPQAVTCPPYGLTQRNVRRE
ncbi:hypothetical protein GCM10027290_39810 [Micromonospora sonneratiae]